MKKIKTILTSFVLLAVMLLACGCAQVDVSTKLYSDGVALCLDIYLDEQDISDASLNLSSVKNAISNYFDYSATSVKQNFVSSYNTLVSQKASSEDKTKLFASLTTSYCWSQTQTNHYYLYFNFLSYDAYNFWAKGGETEATDDDNIVTQNLFYTKTTSQGLTVFAQQVGEYNNMIQAAVASVKSSTGITDDSLTSGLEFNYNYCTPYSQIHSNADSVSYDTTSGLYVHSWKVNEENVDDNIELYYFSVRAYVWYVLALIISCAFVLIAFIIVGINKKIKNTKQIKTDN